GYGRLLIVSAILQVARSGQRRHGIGDDARLTGRAGAVLLDDSAVLVQVAVHHHSRSLLDRPLDVLCLFAKGADRVHLHLIEPFAVPIRSRAVGNQIEQDVVFSVPGDMFSGISGDPANQFDAVETAALLAGSLGSVLEDLVHLSSGGTVLAHDGGGQGADARGDAARDGDSGAEHSENN
ncbi:hypothetical protein PENTCL1PPCAC_9650, partial [Pristionchus entomophagus]